MQSLPSFDCTERGIFPADFESFEPVIIWFSYHVFTQFIRIQLKVRVSFVYNQRPHYLMYVFISSWNVATKAWCSCSTWFFKIYYMYKKKVTFNYQFSDNAVNRSFFMRQRCIVSKWYFILDKYRLTFWLRSFIYYETITILNLLFIGVQYVNLKATARYIHFFFFFFSKTKFAKCAIRWHIHTTN